MAGNSRLRPLSFFNDREPDSASDSRSKHYWVGIDGEGITEGEPRLYNRSTAITGSTHRYISMSYWTADGKIGDQIENRQGLSTKECLNFILSISESAKIAAYGFGYDLSKILEDLPPELLYLLTHPDKHSYKCAGGRSNFRPVIWEGFALDLFNSRFKVGRAEIKDGKIYGREYRIVHDLAKFYQAKFVSACQNWDVGNAVERNTMRAMKADRRNLIRYTQQEILDYSNKECQWLAELAEKLDDACEQTGANLRGQYFGAGSIAKALMREWNIKEQIGELPAEVKCIARIAFFGGRFEISRRGKVKQPVHDWDISSAYPYQIFQLPCLKCGKWRKTRDEEEVKSAQVALVNYSLRPWKSKNLPPWGPFPFRDADGTIPFPIESGGGWVHRSEYLIGQKLFPNVRFIGAWVYHSNCSHRPFEKVREVYLERLRIGKEGPGIVLKLGTNAIAGSIMQVIGTRPYHCPVWAGMITSGTRAQLLEMLGQHEKWSDVIMMATDGLWGISEVTAPKPLETGTDVEVIEEKTGKRIRKPLGGWEHDVFSSGVFMARPGIYFPLDMAELSADEENEADEKKIKDLKARGIGIRTLYKHRETLMAHYERAFFGQCDPYIIGDENPLEVIRTRSVPQGVERFVGMKSGVIRNVKKDEEGRMIGETYRKRDVYGLWTLQHRQIDFRARPKRDEGDGTNLEVRRMPLTQKSEEYDKMKSKMTIEDILAGVTELGHFDDEQDDWGEG